MTPHEEAIAYEAYLRTITKKQRALWNIMGSCHELYCFLRFFMQEFNSKYHSK